MNKNKIFKILIIVIDVAVLFGLIISFIKWTEEKQNNNDYIISNSSVMFRKFTFKIPKDITYEQYDLRTFLLTGKNYKAKVEIYIDRDNYMLEKHNNYYKELLDFNYNIEKTYEKTVDNNKMIIYNRKEEDTNSVLCYCNIKPAPFAAEIELFNEDNSYKTDNLKSIIDVLMNNTYDYKDKKLYEYYDTSMDPVFNENLSSD